MEELVLQKGKMGDLLKKTLPCVSKATDGGDVSEATIGIDATGGRDDSGVEVDNKVIVKKNTEFSNYNSIVLRLGMDQWQEEDEPEAYKEKDCN